MKKYLAVFFALVLVVAMLPGIAAAEGDTPDPIGEETTEGDQQLPEENPGENPDEDLGENPDENLGENPDENPGENPDENPGENPDENPGENPDENPGEDPPQDPGLLPDSPFYFLKRFVENIKVWFTFDQERKTDLLSQLVDLRASELEALEEKYAEDELTDRQKEKLAKAAEDLVAAAEGFFERLLGSGEDLEDLELAEDQISKLETALVNMGLAMERILEPEEDPGDDEPGDCDGERLTKQEKYQKRIAHLEQIRDRNPEASHSGLNRAIENALRQQARWEEKFGVTAPNEDDEEDDEEEEEPGLEGELDAAGEEGPNLADAGNDKDKTNNDNDKDKAKNDNGNNGKDNGNEKTNNGKSSDKANNGKAPQKVKDFLNGLLNRGN